MDNNYPYHIFFVSLPEVTEIMQSDTYKTIAATSKGVYKEKGSKFLAFAVPVSCEKTVKSQVESYRRTYYDARHVCFAYSIGIQREECRFNDDGEPSGTAGRPIFGQIQSFGLTNVLVIVVRYFGGVLLGTGGLAVAYRSAASEALKVAEIIEKTVDTDFRIRFEFPFMNSVMHLVKSFGVEVLEQRYEMDCIMWLRIRKNEAGHLKDALRMVESLRIVDESK